MKKKDLFTNKKKYTIAVAGNPNVGKSTIFNNLTGLHQHTGNWTGKTVSNAVGNYEYLNQTFELVDLPGIYSLMSNSEEEEIARNFLCFNTPDCTLIIVDGTCLERNLNLVFQIMDITSNIVLCVNLLDEAEKKGISINTELLSKYLGIPVIGTIGKNKKHLNKLQEALYSACNNPIRSIASPISYPENINSNISTLLPIIQKTIPIEYIHLAKWICIKLIERNLNIINLLEEKLNVQLLSNQEISSHINNIENVTETISKSIAFQSENICNDVCNFCKPQIFLHNQKIDKILTSKTFGIPIMLLFLGIIFWITISGANYPSELLSNMFAIIKPYIYNFLLYIQSPLWLISLLLDGIYGTVSCVISVMLPPMLIFFPLFTFLEDLGYLPRIAFNLDPCFQKSCTSGKQALTMCMGFGCNAVGVTGCRIISSPRERIISILTNTFMPCNGRFPILIIFATLFIRTFYSGPLISFYTTLTVLAIILLGIFLTLIVSKILSKTILKGFSSSFILELPQYRKPEIKSILIHSIVDKTLLILGRAILVSIPAGIIIWLCMNFSYANISIFSHLTNMFTPFAYVLGLDGTTLLAYILSFPANELTLPIILMGYLKETTMIDLTDINIIQSVLLQNGWTILTYINAMIFTLLHFPCGTTLYTIAKETKSWKYTIISIFVPLICGSTLCIISTVIYNLIF